MASVPCEYTLGDSDLEMYGAFFIHYTSTGHRCHCLFEARSEGVLGQAAHDRAIRFDCKADEVWVKPCECCECREDGQAKHYDDQSRGKIYSYYLK